MGRGGGEEMENGYEIAGWTMVREWRRGVEGRAAGREGPTVGAVQEGAGESCHSSVAERALVVIVDQQETGHATLRPR